MLMMAVININTNHFQGFQSLLSSELFTVFFFILKCMLSTFVFVRLETSYLHAQQGNFDLKSQYIVVDYFI